MRLKVALGADVVQWLLRNPEARIPFWNKLARCTADELMLLAETQPSHDPDYRYMLRAFVFGKWRALLEWNHAAGKIKVLRCEPLRDDHDKPVRPAA